MNVTTLTKLCERCKRRIKADALSCVCGWSIAAVTEDRGQHIQCCFSGCPRSGIVKTWTKTGWAHVCFEDYGRLEYTPRPTDNPHVRSVRAAYEKSNAFKRRQPGHISEVLPERIPGEDDSMEAA